MNSSSNEWTETPRAPAALDETICESILALCSPSSLFRRGGVGFLLLWRSVVEVDARCTHGGVSFVLIRLCTPLAFRREDLGLNGAPSLVLSEERLRFVDRLIAVPSCGRTADESDKTHSSDSRYWSYSCGVVKGKGRTFACSSHAMCCGVVFVRAIVLLGQLYHQNVGGQGIETIRQLGGIIWLLLFRRDFCFFRHLLQVVRGLALGAQRSHGGPEAVSAQLAVNDNDGLCDESLDRL